MTDTFMNNRPHQIDTYSPTIKVIIGCELCVVVIRYKSKI